MVSVFKNNYLKCFSIDGCKSEVFAVNLKVGF